MTAEKTHPLDADEIRIEIIRLAFEAGHRTSETGPGSEWAPWLVGGLKALEDGRELTAELLEELDRGQVMYIPTNASPVRVG